MILSREIRIIPTKEQEMLLWKSCGTARYVYNMYLYVKQKEYKENNKSLSQLDFRKQITQLKKTNKFAWMNEVGSNVIKQAVKDADNAYRNFFTHKSHFPKFKSKKNSKQSFYVNYERFSVQNHYIRCEKIGLIKIAEQVPKTDNAHYTDTRISFDGKYWYISLGYEQSIVKPKLNSCSLGVDLGVKNLAVCSDGKVYKNINKTHKMRKLVQCLRRQERKLSRKVLLKTTSSNNFAKNKRKVKLLYRRINNIRHNYLHQVTTEIVKTKPSRIVIEDLDVIGMMKNKHLAKAIAEQCFYTFANFIKYKSERYGINLVIADRWFPSSKMCHKCGNIKHNLNLKDRIYVCESCGEVVDRDYNASLNLANYSVA